MDRYIIKTLNLQEFVAGDLVEMEPTFMENSRQRDMEVGEK